ncbi:MAG: Hsp20/alpha crystallin family protein [Planctomycetota bacterium]
MLPTLRRSFDNPWDLFREVDRVFRDGVQGAVTSGSYPVDIHETEDAYLIEADLPGVQKEHVEVSVDSGVLSVSAERTATENRGEPRVQERRFERLERSFRLPQSVQGDAIDAKLHEGVLTVRLPKREEVKPRRVEIQ